MTRRLLWWAACGGILLAGVYLHRWLSLAGDGAFKPVDFDTFYVGSTLVRDGLGNRLYDFGTQAQYQLRLLGRLPMRGFLLPYVSPPHLALLLTPLSLLSLSSAYFVWIGLQLALGGILLRQCFMAGSASSPQKRILLLAGVVSFPMLTITIYKGQLSLILLLCVVGWAAAFRKGNDPAIAGWLLLGSIKPQLILAPILLTIMARKWRALAFLTVGSILILLMCVLFLGPSCVMGFLSATLWVDSSFDHRLVYPAFMYNFKGFLTLLLGPNQLELIKALSRVGLVGALLLIVYLWRGRVDTLDEKFDLRLGLSLLLGLFFSPHLYYYDVLMLAAVGRFFNSYLVQINARLLSGIFLAAVFALPPLFLENAWIVLAGCGVRLPAVLMGVWIAWMYCLLQRQQCRLAPVKE